jgi:hypothetical protein
MNNKSKQKSAYQRIASFALLLAMLFSTIGTAPAAALADGDVSIISPDNGEILDGTVLLQANVVGAANTGVLLRPPRRR